MHRKSWGLALCIVRMSTVLAFPQLITNTNILRASSNLKHTLTNEIHITNVTDGEYASTSSIYV